MGLPWFTSPAVGTAAKSDAAMGDAASAAAGFRTISGTTCLVTGSSGLCGSRLVELLLERGGRHVVAFDRQPPSAVLQRRFQDVQARTGGRITVLAGSEGDLCSDAAVRHAFELVRHDKDTATPSEGSAGSHSYDIIFHLGALVGPFYPRDVYHAVNHHGTVRLLDMAKAYGCPRFVYSSSPSTRFRGHADICGARDLELPYPDKYLAMYAEAKAHGEMAVAQAHGTTLTSKSSNSNTLHTVSVAPHQVYGPHDSLMLPNLLESAGTGRLRIFGAGRNRISVTYVDNYCHGLLCGADALVARPSVVGGKFYIVTDDSLPEQQGGDPGVVYFWDWINQAVVGMGFTDLHTKWHLPVWLLYTLAYVGNAVAWITGAKFKLNPFNVTMLIIHRYFNIENAQRDLEYRAVKPGPEAWAETIEWFRENWLPEFQRQQKHKGGSGGLGGLNQVRVDSHKEE